MKGIKGLGILLMFVVSVFASLPLAHASTGTQLGLSVTEVKINGDAVTDNETVRTDIQKDNTLDVTVRFQTDNNSTNSTNAAASNVEVSTFLTGIDNSRVTDTSEVFDIVPGVVYTKHLTLQLPIDMQQGDYKLRVTVADRYSGLFVANYNLKIESSKHNIMIKDVVLSPDDEVKAGRALLATVRLENYGVQNEQNVKVRVSIPDLAISATQYLDVVNAAEAKSSEELYLRLPTNAKSGTYDVVTTITYNDGNSKATKTGSIKVVGSESSTNDGSSTDNGSTVSTGTTIAVGAQSQSVIRGEGGAIYQITVTNSGSTQKQYTLDLVGASEWATFKINPGNVLVVGPGESKSAYVYVAAMESAGIGSHPFSVDVKSGDKTLKSLSFTSDVIDSGASSKTDLKKALEIGLVVLVALLIVVAIIVAITRSHKDEQLPEDSSSAIAQTYY